MGAEPVDHEPVDYAKLSLKDALDLAIQLEEQAGERYETFTRELTRTQTLRAAGFFRFMADSENRHAAELRGRRRKLFGDQPVDLPSRGLPEGEAPAPGELRPDLTTREALALALRGEQRAYSFFRAALEHVHDAKVRTLFKELRDEELHHQELVRRELERQDLESVLEHETLTGERSGR